MSPKNLICQNYRSIVQSFQLFEDGTCVFCDNAMQRGAKGVPSKPREIIQDNNKAPPSIFKLKLSTPIFEDEQPFRSFFAGRILKALKEKHPEFEYVTWRDANKAVIAFEFEGTNEKIQRELKSCLERTVKKVCERRAGKQ